MTEDRGKVYRSSVLIQLGGNRNRDLSSEAVEFRIDLNNRALSPENSARVGKPEVEIAPEFIIKPRRQFVDEGQPAKFKASFEGSPKPDVVWTKNGQPVQVDSRHKIFEKDDFHFLEILSVSPQDKGKYTCTIQNSLGKVSMSADLEIFPKPETFSSKPRAPTLMQPLRDQTVAEGDKNVQLDCRVSEAPDCSTVWYKDGQEIKPGRQFRTKFDHRVASLVLTEALEEDMGQYECVITGPFGELKSSCYLTVEISDEKHEPPVFVKELRDMEVDNGDKVELVVEVKGSETIEVFWIHNNRELSPNDNEYQFVSEGNIHKLILPRVFQQDAGEYVCEAYNDYGDTDTFCRLTVKEVDIPFPPEFITRPKVVTTEEGTSAVFSCQVKGRPPPTVQWERDGMAVKDNNRFKICCQGDEHILEILDTNKIDAGKYLCKLENTTGSISYTTSLIVKDNMPSMTDFRSVLRARPSLEKLGKHNSTDSEKSDKENEQHDFCRVLTQRGDKDSHLQKQENKNSQTSVKQHDFTQVLTRHVDKVSQLQKEENNNSHTPVKQCDFSQVLTRHVDKVSHQQKQDDNYHTSAKQLDFRKVLKNKAEKLEKVSVDIGKIVPETNGGGTVRGKLNKFETNASTSRSKPRAQTEEIHRAQITQVKKSPPCGISVKAPEKEITENSLKRHLDKFEPKTVTSRSKSRAQTEEIHRVQITHVEKSPFGISVKNPQNEETDSPLKRHPDKFEPKTVTSRLKPRAQTEEIHHVESSVETDSPLKRQLDKFEKLPSNESRKSRNVSAESTTKPPKDANSSLKGKLNKFENLASYETSKPQTETTTILLPKGTENLNSLKGKLSKFEKISSGEVSLKPKKEPPVLPSLKTRTDKFERPFGDSCKTESLKKTDYLAKVKMDKFEKFASLEITTKPKAEQKDFRNVLKKNIDDQRQAPRIRRKLTNQRVKYGNPVVMECEIDGDTVDWSINGKEIKPSKFFKISLSQDNTATLVIAEAYSEDEGEYICTASNKFGSASSSCHLFVEASSSHSSKSDMEGPVTVPVRILSLTPSSIAVLKGNRIEIKATFTGEPKPEIRWFKARDEVYTGGKIQVKNCEENSILVIGDIQPNNSGKYTIKADNHIATDSASVSVSVEDVPEPPVGKPHPTDVMRTSVTLSWYGPAFDGGSQITFYRIEMKKPEDTNWELRVPCCKNTFFQIDDLEPNSEYVFRVSAENKHGVSSPGDASEIVKTGDSQPLSYDYESDGAQEVFSPGVEIKEKDELPFEPQDVTISPGKIFEDHYDIMHEVGKGKFGNVYKCKEKKTGKTWAAKIVKCREKEKEDVRHEIDIMKSLAHPKVLMIWDAYEAPRRMVLVMEYIGGGELFERVIGEGFVLTERDCVIFMRQICSGVSYMHTKGILHLDLKPENILCISENTNQVKIIDFGLARRFEEGNSIKVMFGTPEFIAPEVVNYDEISFATDMWSLGVICYVLLSGLSPFMGDNDPETLANVTSGEYDFDDESFNDISDNAKDFIQRLLVKNKEKRSTISQSQQHIWLAQDERQIRSKRLNTERLRRFMARRKWQKTGTAIRALGRMASLQRLMSGSVSSSSSVDRHNSSASDSSHSDSADSHSLALHKSSFSSPISKVCEECEVFRKDTKEISHSGEATVCRNSQSENETATHQSQDEHQDLKTSSQGSERENLPISGLDLTENECSVNENNFSSCYDGTDPKAYRDENHVDIPTDLTQSKPNFVKTMVDCEAFAGDVIRFDVRVAGSPEAEIHWLHEEDEVQEDERHIMDTNNNGQCSLIIRKVTEDDEGEYMCTAVNSCGEASCSAELIVCGSGAF